ncbi:T9SS type A sorting domain-containing protein [bacterium]|nr:T9SS type A sorting domain-containing protein [bacterium]
MGRTEHHNDHPVLLLWFARVAFALLAALLIAGAAWATDFYVTTDGLDDPDRGMSIEDPFHTITYALSVADTTAGRPHVIHIASGTYGRTEESYPLPMIDQTTLRGAGPTETILDAGSQTTNLVTAVGAENWTIESLAMTGGRAIQGGAILAAQGGPMTLRNLHLYGNRADHPTIPDFQGFGGAIYIGSVDGVTLDHLLLTNNSARDNGGAISIVESAASLTHLTFSGNLAEQGPNSSALFASGGLQDEVTLTNSIVWGNGYDPIFDVVVSGERITVSHSIIQTEEGVWPGVGNLVRDPLYADPGSDYHLLNGSPAIDLGAEDAPFENEPAPNGGRVNAGFYGNTPDAQVSEITYPLRHNRWALIGLPVDAPSSDPQELFGGSLDDTEPGEDTWRLRRWDPTEQIMLRYNEPEAGGVDLGDPPPMEPGTGYLIRQHVLPTATLSIAGSMVDPADPHQVSYPVLDRQAYHTIANPYPFPIDRRNIRIMYSAGSSNTFEAAVEEGLVSRFLYVMDGRGKLVPSLGGLQPWQGAVLISLDNRTRGALFIPNSIAPEPGDLLEGLDWGLLVSASALDENGEVLGRDAGHLFGAGGTMQNGVDVHDGRLIDWNQANFDLRFVADRRAPLFHDVRTTIFDGMVREWNMTFTSRILPDNPIVGLADSVEISIEGFRSLVEDGFIYPSEEYNYWLLDENYNVLVEDLRTTPMVRLPLHDISDTERSRSFWIFVGNNSTSAPEDDVTATQPASFALLDVYPNPFNASTTLRYRVSKPGEVRMRVFDILGRDVFSDRWQATSAGVQQRTFEASSLASGTYFLRLETEGQANVRRVSLLK